MKGWNKARYLDYFFAFSVMRTKLAVFRACFFVLVGLDGILQLPHAARYGASDFNVGHFAWLDALLPAPGRATMVVIFLLQAYLGVRIAMGAAVRSALWLLTGLYGYAYFVSQLDSYQHHYLVFLLLLLCCFLPWQRPARADSERKSGDKEQPADERVQSYAARMIFVQLGVVYLFAALTKCEALWIDGTLLDKQLAPGVTRDMAEWIGMGSAAVAVLLTEAFLAVAFISGRLWSVALVVGVALHAGIEFFAGFKIGIFSYYMFALYLLLVPDGWFRAVARRVAGPVEALRAGFARVAASSAGFGLFALIALVGGFLCARAIPVAESVSFALIVTALVTVAVAICLRPRLNAPRERRMTRASAVLCVHLIACAAILFLPETDERIGDYYKFWAGSARRLNHWDEAGAAYERLSELRPDWAPAHYYLGRIAQKDERLDEALAHYERAQQANRDDYRSFLQAALIHHAAGRGQEALAAARHAARALVAMASTQSTQRAMRQARSLIEHWTPRVQATP